MKIWLLAGEPSGDALGAALIDGLRALVPDVELRGVAGPMMQARGMESLFPMDELSVMGLAEVLPRYPALRRRLKACIADVLDWRPDVLITIDSPDFSLRLAKGVKAGSSIRTVHYVAPTVWAWRPGRAKKMARFVDQVLTLFPFEPPYMEAAGIAADFVGHPIATLPEPTGDEVAAVRSALGLGDAPVVLVLPGSRTGEVRRLAPVFGEAISLAFEPEAGVRIAVAAARPVAGLVREAIAAWPGDPVVFDPTDLPATEAETWKRALFHASDVALAASGTVSLELAQAHTPMVVAYDMAPLTRAILKRMLLVDTVTLVNLVSETRVVPEYLGENCRPDRIAEGLKSVIANPAAQSAALSETMTRLGQGGENPGLRAARAVLARLPTAD